METQLGLTEAIFYYDFPTFRDYEDEVYRPKVLLLTPIHGVVALYAVPEPSHGQYDRSTLQRADEELSQFFSILFGRLLKSRLLRKARNEFVLPFNALIYAPGLSDSSNASGDLDNDLCTSVNTFVDWLSDHAENGLENDVFLEARSIVEGAKALTRPKPREVAASAIRTKAGILSAIESEIANFDAGQRKAGITTVAGPQRIRGLAGTGKTIVLAMKVAQIHLNSPKKRILYTFYTKSLYDLIKQLITRFYRHYKDSDPDWKTISILHAWGGANMDGVYHRACVNNGALATRWRDVPAIEPDKFGMSADASWNPSKFRQNTITY